MHPFLDQNPRLAQMPFIQARLLARLPLRGDSARLLAAGFQSEGDH